MNNKHLTLFITFIFIKSKNNKKNNKKACINKKSLYLCTAKWDGSSVGLERMLDRHEVTSSILVRPTRRQKAFFY